MKWFSIKDKLPQHDIEVLMWIRCINCEGNSAHEHTLLSSPPNIYNEMIIGYYYEEDEKEYWYPVDPSHWAYICAPIFED